MSSHFIVHSKSSNIIFGSRHGFFQWTVIYFCAQTARHVFMYGYRIRNTTYSPLKQCKDNSFAPVSHYRVAESLTYEQSHSTSLTLLVQPFSAIYVFVLSAWTTPTHIIPKPITRTIDKLVFKHRLARTNSLKYLFSKYFWIDFPPMFKTCA